MNRANFDELVYDKKSLLRDGQSSPLQRSVFAKILQAAPQSLVAWSEDRRGIDPLLLSQDALQCTC